MKLKTINLPEAYWFQEGPGVRNWQFKTSGVKLLNVGNILKEGRIDLSKTDRHLDENEISSKYSHFLLDSGDLVIASSGISVDDDGLLRTRGAFIRKEHLPLCLNTSTIRFKNKDGISDLRFLKHWIQSREFRTQISHEVTGIAQKNFGPSHLNRIKINLPSLPEQKRIAEVLDKADELRAKRRAALDKLDVLAQSIFLEMFGEPVTNLKGWKRLPFSEVLTKIESGWSPVCLDRPVLGNEWGVLKLGAITWCEYNPAENKALPSEINPDSTIEVKPGDLLFSRKNTYELVAACALVKETPPHLMMSDLIFRLCLHPDSKIDSCFLHQLLIYPSKRREIQKLAGGSASSMPNISKSKLQDVLIEIPPLPLQREFAARIAAVENLKAAHRASLEKLDALFASLQDRAFKGEL